MKQKWLCCAATLIALSFLVVTACNTSVKDEKQTSSSGGSSTVPEGGKVIEPTCKVKSITFASLDVNNKTDKNAFKEAGGFNKDYNGPYTIGENDVKTAHLVVRVDIDKPAGDNDFTIEISNENSYLTPVKFSRKTIGEDAGVFTSKKNVILAKGANNILVNITAPDGKKDSYHFVVKYSGGPDEKTANRLIPGVYCPTQRKPSAGEKEEHIWVAYIAGWCGYCPIMLNMAGKHLATEHFKQQGLRVVSVCVDGRNLSQAFKKWKDSGKNYPMYTHENNCLYGFFKVNSLPYSYCITKGKADTGKGNDDAERHIENVKKTFGLN